MARPARRHQPAPGEKKRPGGTNIVARPGQKHGITQRGLVLDAAYLSGSCRCRGQRQALPPDAGPSLLPPDDRILQA
jgi:hypothetical protein